MPKRAILAAAALALLAGAAACEKTTPAEGRATPAGTVQLTPFSWNGAIPAAYGRLVAVTSSAANPGWAQLWFERPDSSIVAVFVHYQTGDVRDKILELPRS
jgi:hypothetical protein